MTPSRNTKTIVWTATVLLVCTIVALAIYLPIVAAVVFVFLVALFAIGKTRKEGKLKSAVYFLKEIMFGW